MLLTLVLIATPWASAQQAVTNQPGGGVGVRGASSSPTVSGSGVASTLRAAFTFSVPVQVSDLMSETAAVQCRVDNAAHSPGSGFLSGITSVALQDGAYAGVVTVEVRNDQGLDISAMALMDQWVCTLVVPDTRPAAHTGGYTCTLGLCGLSTNPDAPIDIRVGPGAVTVVSGDLP